jgi:hypothetical protein
MLAVEIKVSFSESEFYKKLARILSGFGRGWGGRLSREKRSPTKTTAVAYRLWQ